MRAPISTAVAIAFGLIVLLGYFLRVDLLISLRSILLEWALVLAAVALLIGLANLVYVHWRKMMAGGFYSAVLLFSLVLTLGVVGWYGPTHPNSLWIFNYIQLPVESSLAAILAVVLIYAAVRLLYKRKDLLSVVFIGTVLVVLLATTPLFGFEVPGLNELRTWIAQVPAVGGARGILLGVALGILATGLRILTGSDRPYGG
jgi:hypothetical protein